MPAFARDLTAALRRQGHDDLAAEIASLPMLGLCPCGEPHCTSFYTEPPPDGAYGNGHENITVDGLDGLVILDVVGRRIAFVEALDSVSLREELDALAGRVAPMATRPPCAE